MPSSTRSSQAVFKYVENKQTLKNIISICNLFNRFIMNPHFVTYTEKPQYLMFIIIFKLHY